MRSANTRAEDCSLRIEWTAPDARGAPILAYAVEIQSSDDQFYTEASCGVSSTVTSCVLPMEVLSAEPYLLQEGDLIVVRVAAQNEKGWGLASQVNPTGATLRTPHVMQIPELASKTDDSIRLRWARTSGATYDVWWAAGTADLEELATDLSSAQYEVTNLDQGARYRFQVRADGICGPGPFSPELTVTLATGSPAQMAEVQVTDEGCNARFEWEAPDDAGSPIEGYYVEVLGQDGTFHALTDCDQGPEAHFCLVPWASLRQAPYNLSDGNRLEVQVAARNANGTGDTSPVSVAGETMHALPRVSLPRMANKTRSAVTLEWDTTRTTTDPSLSPEYVVYIATGGEDAEFTDRRATAATPFTVTDLEQGQTYRFKITAKDCRGEGRASPTLEVRLAEAPGQMGTVRTASEGCAVNISWAAPDDGGSPLQGYTIEIGARSGSFFPLSDTQCTTSVDATSCVVPMTDFIGAPYNLSEDDLISVRARATNALGDSVWSAPNSIGAVVVTAPPALASPVLANETPDSVTVSWTPLGTANYVYELEFDQDGDGTFVQIFSGEETSHTVAKEEGRRSYSFRVRALNSCSSESSPFSPTLIVSLTSTPDEVSGLSTSAEACSLRINWSAPNDNGSLIQQYIVEVRSSSREMDQYESCGSPAQTTCLIPMSELSQAPFNL
jgi:hypothetical protein